MSTITEGCTTLKVTGNISISVTALSGKAESIICTRGSSNCAQVQVHMHVCTHTCVCMWVWRLVVNSSCCSSGTIFLVSWHRVFPWLIVCRVDYASSWDPAISIRLIDWWTTLFWDMVSLCRLDCLRTHQEAPASVSQVLGLTVWDIKPGNSSVLTLVSHCSPGWPWTHS